jgi:tRNA nucleotidyltransferase/poly(A) polymerase
MASTSEALERILSVMDRMEIPYLIGGSVASSAHGIPRTTMDVDFVANLQPEQIDEFVEAVRNDFYVDPDTVREAIRRQRSFNLIHTASVYKFDIFPLRQDAYSRIAFERRRFMDVRSFGSPVECAVASAEDTILRKLEWYRAGGQSSERQWNDLRGVRDVSGKIVDYAYLREWAKFLKVDDLLEELLNEEPR